MNQSGGITTSRWASCRPVSSSQRLFEIGNEIRGIFQTYRNANEIIGNPVGRMHHRNCVLDEAFRAAKAASVDKETDP